ncbi:MAG: hypothetical protein ACLGGX_08455 [Bdellovibrionia bacterium]
MKSLSDELGNPSEEKLIFALGKLSLRERQILFLRYWNHDSNEQIRKSLQMEEQEILKTTEKIITKMKRWLQKQPEKPRTSFKFLNFGIGSKKSDLNWEEFERIEGINKKSNQRQTFR